MSSLNKFELNKLIVSMRHNVSRAKVHTINKLTRQAKKLKSKKASELLKMKNDKKAERLVNEVLVMKKIPLDEVSAFSLGNPKEVDDILKDDESSLRLKALARLSGHSSISPVVKHFRLKYPLWEKEFPTVLIALKNSEKLKKNKNNESRSKEELKKIPKEDFELDSNETDDELDEKDSLSEVVKEPHSKLNERILNKVNLTPPQDEEVVFTKGNRFSVSSDDFTLSDSQLSNLQEEISPSKRKLCSIDKTNKLDKSKDREEITKKNMNISSTNQPKVKAFNNIKQNNFSIKTTNNSPDSSKNFNIAARKSNSPKAKIRKAVDDFFLASDNKPYEAIKPVYDNVKNNESTDDENDNFDSDNNTEHNIKNRKKMKPFAKKQLNISNQTNKKNVPKFNKDNQFKNNKLSKTVSKSKQILTEKADEKLHPSWLAKRKMSSLANFQGKKIVFD